MVMKNDIGISIEKQEEWELGILLLVEEHPMMMDREYTELYEKVFGHRLTREEVSDALERLRSKELISMCYTLIGSVPVLRYRVRKANAVGIEWSMIRNIISTKEDIRKLYKEIMGD